VVTEAPANLIPRFIADKYQEHVTNGSFEGTALFMDIRGFTALTEELMAYGRQGLESLAQVMNALFTPVANTIHAYHGFIAFFSGDALTAIFPRPVPAIKACHAAWRVGELFRRAGNQHTRAGTFRLNVKIGLANGNVQWGIVPCGHKHVFFFSGNALQLCQAAQKRSGEHVVMHRSMRPFLGPGKEYHQGSEFVSVPPHSVIPEPTAYTETTMDREILRRFIDDNVLRAPPGGEFRRVASLFISTPMPHARAQIHRLMQEIAREVHLLQGSLFPMDSQDGSVIFPIVMGAPIAHEDDCRRALHCVQALRSRLDCPLHAGVSFGPAFTGFIGAQSRKQYTCLGDTMNTAARLMAMAPAQETYLTKTAVRMAAPRFQAVYFKRVSIRGKGRKMDIYHLPDRDARQKATPFSGPFIGRQEELQTLKLAMDAYLAAARPRGVIFLTGEPGVGKSRLAYRLMCIYKECATPFILQADRFSKTGFYAFSLMLQDFFPLPRHADASGREAAYTRAFNRLLPERANTGTGKGANARAREYIRLVLRYLIGLSKRDPLSGLGGMTRKQIISRALLAFFQSARKQRPLLLVVEDLHWLDADSRYALEMFSKAEIPIVVLATIRAQEMTQQRPLDFGPQWPCTTCRLKCWTADDIRAYLEKSLSAPVTKTFLQHVAARTEGIPLYIEQYLRYLRDNELISRGAYGFELRQGVTPELPPGLGSLLVSRIDRFPVALKETVQIACVLGQQFSSAVLTNHIDLAIQAIPDCHIDRERIRLWIQRAAEEDIWHMGAGSRYAFHHDLLREAAYNMQSRNRLRMLHLSAGICLEKQPAHEAFYRDMMFHFRKAENDGKALKYAILSAEYARIKKAFTQAIDGYTNGLELAQKIYGNTCSQTAFICYKLGWSYAQVNRFAIARQHLEAALDFYRQHPSAYADKLVWTYLALSIQYTNQGKYAQAVAFNEQAYPLCLRYLGDAHTAMAVIFNVKAVLAQVKGDNTEAYAYAEKSLAINRTLYGTEHLDVAASYNVLGYICMHLGRWQEAETCHRKALAIKQAIFGDFHYELALSYHNLASTLLQQGKLDQVEPLFQKALDIALHFVGENNLYTALTYGGFGSLYKRKHQYEKALSCYQRALVIRRELVSKQHPTIAVIYVNLADVHLEMDALAQAKTFYQRALEIQRKVLGKEHPALFKPCSGLCAIYLKKGRYRRALECLEHIAKDSRILRKQNNENKAAFHHLMGRVLLGMGKQKAAHHFRRAAGLFARLNKQTAARKIAASIRECPPKG